MIDRACGCRVDEVLDALISACGVHEPDYYAELAHRATANELLAVLRGGTVIGAIRGALRGVERYAEHWACDVEKLRAALETEARRRAA